MTTHPFLVGWPLLLVCACPVTPTTPVTDMSATPPECSLTLPDGPSAIEREEVVVEGRATDDKNPPRDLMLELRSDLDGLIAEPGPRNTGDWEVRLSSLRLGMHTLTVTVRDPQGAECVAQATLEIQPYTGPNRPPTAPQVAFSPEVPTASDALEVEILVESRDEDADPITYSYAWTREGEAVDNQTPRVMASETRTGEQWAVTVTPNDGKDDGPGLRATVIIAGPRQRQLLRPVRNESLGVFMPSISASQGRVLLGTPGENVAHIYERQGLGAWVEVAELTQEMPQGLFGSAVALVGDRAVVSSRGAGTIVYERQGDGAWANVAQLPRGGRSVALSGDRILLGSDRIAFLFERRQDGAWEEITTLTASNGGEFDVFGIAVAIEGDVAMIGDPGEDSCPGEPGSNNGCQQAGAVYLFVRSDAGVWEEVALLKGSNTEADDSFGTSISISGDVAVIGAPGEDGCAEQPMSDNGCKDAGAAYLLEFRDGTWQDRGPFKAPDAQATDGFGRSVDLVEGRFVVGASGEGDCAQGSGEGGCKGAGAAYYYEGQPNGAWTLVGRLKASNAEERDFFGSSVGLSEFGALVGAPGEDGCEGEPEELNSCSDAGAVYVFE